MGYDQLITTSQVNQRAQTDLPCPKSPSLDLPLDVGGGGIQRGKEGSTSVVIPVPP